MDRRQLLKFGIPAAYLGMAGSTQAALKVPRFKMRKNLVLVTVDLGLYANHFREYKQNSHYFSKFFGQFSKQSTYFSGMHEPGLGNGHEMEHATFTCLKFTDRDRFPERAFVSFDQHIAERSVQETRHKYIYHKVASGSRTASFNSQAQQTPSFNGVGELHDNLFGYTDMGLVKKKLNKKRFILKELSSNVKRRWRGTPEEKALVDSIQFKIEDIDSQLKWIMVKKPRMTADFDAKAAAKAPLKNVDLNYSTVFHALEKKQTKIAMIHFGGGLTRGLSEITHGYHTLSHHGHYPERVKELEIIDSYILAGLSKFLEKLKTAKMLDETIVLFTCAMGDAHAHSSKNIPAFLFGGGFQHKPLIECLDKDKKLLIPTSHLFSSILKQIGSPDVTFSGNKQIIKPLFVRG